MSDKIEKLDPNFAASEADDGLNWYDATSLGIEGRAWDDTPDVFARLPLRAKADVPENVWGLGQHSAGMYVRFQTDSKTIAARWSLRSSSMSLRHMPVSGVSGIDLYGWDDARSDWMWTGIGWPDVTLSAGEQVKRNLSENLDGKLRTYIAYLPGYNGVQSMQVGVEPGAQMLAAERWAGGDKPLCVYGTSIVHGGCTPRTGMTYPAILGRMLNRATINLGFSGNARAEMALFDLLSELDPCAFVIDPLPNMGAQLVAERIEPGVRRLSIAKPDTPIVLIENLIYTWHGVRSVDGLREKNDNLRAAYDALVASGVNNLTYVSSADLLGHDTEATVDGVHPTDLGFLRMADQLKPVIEGLI